MNTPIILLIPLLFMANSLLFAQQPSNQLQESLEKGLLQEEANQNLNAAIEAYQAVLKNFDNDRRIAATATFRLGECYRKLGKTNEAFTQFERVTREFADQDALAKLSQKYLTDAGRLGTTPSTTRSEANPRQPTLSAEQAKLLREEVALVEQQLAEAQARFQNGRASSEEIIQIKRQVTELQKKLPENVPPEKQAALIEYEIQLVQELLDQGQKKFQNGVVSSTDLIPIKRDLLSLQRQLLAAREPAPSSFQTRLNQTVRDGGGGQGSFQQRLNTIVRQAAGAGPEAPTDEETKEIQRIQEIIKNSPDLINALDKGMTPLQEAAKKGQLVLARFLIENGAQVNSGSRNPAMDGGTALHYAAQSGHKAMAELLLDHGADVNARTATGVTPLHLAAGVGYRAVAQTLIAKGAPVNARNTWGQTPLYSAIDGWQQDMADLLLQNKADINAPSNNDFTPLMYAAVSKKTALVEFLVSKGADVNLRDSVGQSALAISVQKDTDPTTEFLLEHGADPNVDTQFNFPSSGGVGITPQKSTPLLYAVEMGKTSLVELLLNHGAQVDLQNRFGRTALYQAVSRQDLVLVMLLLSKDANPNVQDNDGGTPFFVAVEAYVAAFRGQPPSAGYPMPYDAISMQTQREANTSVPVPGAGRIRTIPSGDSRIPASSTSQDKSRVIIDELLAHKADFNVVPRVSSRSDPPLVMAINMGDADLVNKFLAHGAEVNLMKTEESTAPLLAAVNSGRTNLVDLLLVKGANVNIKSTSAQYAPLHVAAARGNTNLIELLVSKGADINVQDLSGNSPLHYAAYLGRKAAVEMLLAQGAKADLPNRNGSTPLAMINETGFSLSGWGIPIGGPSVVAPANRESTRGLTREQLDVYQLLKRQTGKESAE